MCANVQLGLGDWHWWRHFHQTWRWNLHRAQWSSKGTDPDRRSFHSKHGRRRFSCPTRIQETEEEPMHTTLHGCLSRAWRWCLHSYSFTKCCNRNIALAWKRVPNHSSRNDKGEHCPNWTRRLSRPSLISFKGIFDHQLNRHLRFDEELVVPIIENTALEKDLEESLTKAVNDYPGTTAVLVRRHGIYVWGENWQKAKTQCECYDYLFSIAIEMKKFGLDPAAVPEAYKWKLLHRATW